MLHNVPRNLFAPQLCLTALCTEFCYGTYYITREPAALRSYLTDGKVNTTGEEMAQSYLSL